MKKDNKGFTLLELLIAVIILAIVVVPMLRSFATSYRVNARSREIMRATTLAQNEMEIFEKEKLEVLLDDTIYKNYSVTTTTYPEGAGSDDEKHTAYTFTYKKGIINDETGREMFDVVVTLDPESDPTGALASNRYYDQNTKDLLFMNSLSGVDSGTYVQRIRRGEINGEDEEVYQLYKIRQLPDGITGSNYTVDDFARELQRTITLKIEQADQDGYKTTVAKVNYQYRSDYGQVPSEYRTYSAGDKVIFNNSQTLDDKGKPIELKSVYLFYAPRYEYADGTLIPGSATGEKKEDKIIIENKQNLPINIYIIRQNVLDDAGDILGVYTDDSSGDEIYRGLSSYVASIEIYEGLTDDDKTFGKYFTNLNLDMSQSHIKGKTKIKLTDIDTGMEYQYETDPTVMEKTGFRSLGSTESKDRIYSMHVAVYTHGADPTTDEPLVELTGTKIE